MLDTTSTGIEDLGDLVSQHKWIAVTAVVVGLITRLIKDDTKFPITIPPRARIWLVLGMGTASGVLEMVAAGATWQKAIVDGLAGAFLAVIGHETVVASIRSGKELPVPGLMIPGASPSPGAPPTIPPARVGPGQRGSLDSGAVFPVDTPPPTAVDPKRPDPDKR